MFVTTPEQEILGTVGPDNQTCDQTAMKPYTVMANPQAYITCLVAPRRRLGTKAASQTKDSAAVQGSQHHSAGQASAGCFLLKLGIQDTAVVRVS